jgi:hypothetical protein
MNSKKPFNCRMFLFWFFVATLILAFVSGIGVVASPGSTVKVDPPLTSKAPNETFSVDVAVSDIADDMLLVAWEFNLTFNPEVLQAVKVEEGPFLKQAGITMKAGVTIDNSAGVVVAGWSLSSYLEPGASGSGVLATVTFKVVAEGKSPLVFSRDERFHATELRAWNGTELTIISFEVVDGAFGYPSDLAVTSVESSSDLVLAGEVVVVDVTVENLGFVDEVFNVTAFYGSNRIDTQSDVTLESQATKSVSFNWDTTGAAQGTYSLKARVTGVSDDINVTNNEFVGSSVTIGLVHDIAIANVTAFPSSVHSGEKTTVVVTVFNKGSVAETSQVTLWYGASIIGTQSASSLGPGGSWVFFFTWDTKDVAVGNYVLTAMATLVSGETKTADNTLTDVAFEVTAPPLLVSLELLIVVVVVAVAEAVISLAAFMYLRRKGM